MNNFFKGAVVTVIVLTIFIIINVICNMNDIDLNSVTSGPVIAVCAMLIYQGLTKNKK